MRNRLLSYAALMLVCSTSSMLLHAQFQPPTPEELQMKSEPKAPGAAAVYLYREETGDDNLHYHSFYARIKVLTEKGKELATVDIPYFRNSFKITDVKGRTIHADGTIVNLDVKPSDLVEHKAEGFQLNKVVFTLPSVEVGSILEYRWQLRYDDEYVDSPDWMIQQPYYVRKAHYSFQPSRFGADGGSKLLYSSMLPPGTKVVSEPTGKYTLDASDVQATPQEEYMPPLGSLLEQVTFYYSAYFNKEEYWKHEGEKWSKQMDHFADESKMLREAVSGIVSPADSEEVKARKIYDAVMKLDNTDYTRRKSTEERKQLGLKQIKNVDEVWKQKSGSSDEIALLYLALARAAGLKAYAATVCNRDQEIFNEYFMSMRQFDDVLVILSLGGKDIPLDPGKRFAPFGQLAWKHTLTSGMRQVDKGTTFVSMPGNSFKEATTMRIADVTVEKDGTISGLARMVMTGPQATYWREMTVENDEDEVKKRFNEEMRGSLPDGVTADFDHFLGLEDYHSQLMGILKLSGNMGTATGKRVFLPGVFFESRAKHPFVAQETRVTAVDMHYAESVRDEVTYHLPEGYKVESAPVDTKIPWTGHAGFEVKASVDKNDVVVVRVMARAFTLVQPKEYAALRDFYQKVTTADQQQLVLTAAPVTAGGSAGSVAGSGAGQ